MSFFPQQAESGYGSENNLRRHGSLLSLQSGTSLSTLSASSFKVCFSKLKHSWCKWNKKWYKHYHDTNPCHHPNKAKWFLYNHYKNINDPNK